MDLKLTVTCEIEGQEKTWDLAFNRDLITLGRHSMNDVQIPDVNVSAEHARILVEEEVCYLVDLGSSLGTELNGKPAGPHQRLKLGRGDEIRIGQYRIRVGQPDVRLDDSTSEKTAMVAMRMVREVLGNLSGGGKPRTEPESPPWLEVTNDGEAGTRLSLDEEREYRVGREADCDLVLKHWSISRKHAVFRRASDEVVVADMGSKNGVMVNGERLTGPRRVRDGDVVAVGHTEVKFRNPSRSVLDSMDVTRTPPGLSASTFSPPAPSSVIEPPAEPARAVRPAAAAVAAPTPELDLSGRARTPGEPSAPVDMGYRGEPAPHQPPPPPADPAPSGGAYRTHQRPPESSFADYIPMIAGIALILIAVASALYLFVFRG